MAKVTYAERALADLRRIEAFLDATEPELTDEVLDLIFDAVSLLGRHPFVGRPREDGSRELVISRGQTGHVALYDFVPTRDVVRVLAVRHQRESGFSEET